jgi:hypothetical protein
MKINDPIVMLVVGGFVGMIFTKLFPLLGATLAKGLKWASKRAGGWLTNWSFRRTYLDSLITEHGNLNLTGILHVDASAKPKLEDVFISLSVGKYESTTESVSAELEARILELIAEIERHDGQLARRLRKTLQVPHHRGRLGQIQAFLSLLQRDDVTLLRTEQDLFAKVAESFNYLMVRPNLSGPEALKQYNQLAILGGPGTGKTTLLQWVAVTYARHKAGDRLLRKRKLFQQRLEVKAWKFPIFIRLSSIAPFLMEKTADGRDPTVVEVLPHLLLPHLQEYRGAHQYFSRQLEKGRCIVLLDGLDEIPGDTEFSVVSKAVRSLIEKYGKNQFVLSSRMAGWRGGIGVDFRIYQVNELTDRQIEGFIDAWYSTVERNESARDPEAKSQAMRRHVDAVATKQAEELKQAIRENPGLRRLSINPLLLSVVALVHRSRHKLPKERAKLYGDCSELMLLQWDTPKNPSLDRTKLTYLEKEGIIRRIAHSLHTGKVGASTGGREAERAEIERLVADMLPDFGRDRADAPIMVEHLVTRSGMLSERRRNILAFAHHTFQEYYTALELAVCQTTDVIQFFTDERRFDNDWWKEVILLYSCLIQDAKPLLMHLIVPQRDNIFRTRLRLAMACLAERGSVEASLREGILDEVRRVRTGNRLGNHPINDAAVQYLLRWSFTPSWLSASAIHSVQRASLESGERIWSEELAQALISPDSDERAAALAASAQLAPELRDETLLKSLLNSTAAGSASERSIALEYLWAFPEASDRSVPILMAGLEDADVKCTAACCRAIGRAQAENSLSFPPARLEGIVPVLMQRSPHVFPPLLLEWGRCGSASLLEVVFYETMTLTKIPDAYPFVRPAHLETASPALIAAIATSMGDPRREVRVFGAQVLSGLLSTPGAAEDILPMLVNLVRDGKCIPLGRDFVDAVATLPGPLLQPLVDAFLTQGPVAKLQALRLILADDSSCMIEDDAGLLLELLFGSPAGVTTAVLGELRTVDPIRVPSSIVQKLIDVAEANEYRQGREYDLFAAMANLGRFSQGDVIMSLLVRTLGHSARLLQSAAALAIPRLTSHAKDPETFHAIERVADLEHKRHGLFWERAYGLQFRHAGKIALWLLNSEESTKDLVHQLSLELPLHKPDLYEISELVAEIESSERTLDLLLVAEKHQSANPTTTMRVASAWPVEFLHKICRLKGPDQGLGIELLHRHRVILSSLVQSGSDDRARLRGSDLTATLESWLLTCLEQPSVQDQAWDFFEMGV